MKRSVLQSDWPYQIGEHVLEALHDVLIGIPDHLEYSHFADIALFIELSAHRHQCALQHVLIVFVDHEHSGLLSPPVGAQAIDDTAYQHAYS